MTSEDTAGDDIGPSSVESNVGLSTSFGAYSSVSEEDYSRVLREGILVFDTNALLNLYRYTPTARADFLEALRAVIDRIWIPHQVAEEFWRNRENVIGEARGLSERTADDISSVADIAFEKLQQWAGRISLPNTELDPLRQKISSAFNHVDKEIRRLGEPSDIGDAFDTAKDPVLRELEPILEGRVGPALSATDHKFALKEAERRMLEKVPPGFKDQGKKTGDPRGDYLVWTQTLRHAVKQRVDVLFVTGDAKPDWWRIESGERKGPRPELYEEMRSIAGVRLYMSRPDSLLSRISVDHKLSIAHDSVTNVNVVEEYDEYQFLRYSVIVDFVAYLQPRGMDPLILNDQVIVNAIDGERYRFNFVASAFLDPSDFSLRPKLNEYEVGRQKVQPSRPAFLLNSPPSESTMAKLIKGGWVAVWRNEDISFAGTTKAYYSGLLGGSPPISVSIYEI
ncbi:hypothetical protein F4560_008732 [Saccharothrix ecbatanensis]|uniref:PIN like domain-containing protein n=1 Tax=Saccharothrix ecbatanensis TaxID=1105145 RepID=A0A7W9M6H9_9PSEU|nr:PIN domain-containing protein [Saccharothrix ecbatanensis]MBB5808964.1 hypothetical protein [Saccharothrix ecbatanensis]